MKKYLCCATVAWRPCLNVFFMFLYIWSFFVFIHAGVRFSQHYSFLAAFHAFKSDIAYLKYIGIAALFMFPVFFTMSIHILDSDMFKIVDFYKIDFLRFALDNGANPNEADSKGMTLLHYAVRQDNYDKCAILLNYGADPLVKDNNGYPPMNYTLDAGIHALLKTKIAEHHKKELDNTVGLTAQELKVAAL